MHANKQDFLLHQSLIRSCQQARLFRSNKISDSFWRDRDMHADMGEIVKRDHVTRAHPNAAEAGGSSNSTFLRGAVNVNATIARAAVLLFHSTQPNHARHDRITAWRIS